MTTRRFIRYINQIGEEISSLRYLVTAFGGSASTALFFGEYHLTHPQNRTNVTLAAGLFVAAALGEFARQQVAGAAFWNMANEWGNQGDFGFLSRSHPTAPDLTPYATYYPFFLYHRNMGDSLLPVAQDRSGPMVTVSLFQAGEVGAMVVNPTPHRFTLSIDAGRLKGGLANGWQLTGDDLNDVRVRFNGRENGLDVGGIFPSRVKPQLYNFNKNKKLQVDCPPFSLSSLVIF